MSHKLSLVAGPQSVTSAVPLPDGSWATLTVEKGRVDQHFDYTWAHETSAGSKVLSEEDISYAGYNIQNSTQLTVYADPVITSARTGLVAVARYSG